MNILLIGNGFDLEHELPTRYRDFLEFVEMFQSAYIDVKKNNEPIESITNDYIKLLFENYEYEDRLNVLNSYLENNIWINYFKKVYKEHMVNKQNWIDFESEICFIIRRIDEYINAYKNNDVKNQVKNSNPKDKLFLFFHSKVIGKEESLSNDIMLYDLNRLIGALEIYIWDYVGHLNVEYYNPDIERINTDKVISFNYTNTFEKVYAHNKKIEYCFIHGKAKNNFNNFIRENEGKYEKSQIIKDRIESNDMVLGIDEYLSDEEKNVNLEFIGFRKYYQRIYKKTGNEYKKWLKKLDEKKSKEENILYVFGHSLDITDKDVLCEIIKNKNIKTIIFYRNKEQLSQQITNLVKIMGSDEVITRVYGANPCISFMQQNSREKIQGSSFEIMSDIVQLGNIHAMHNIEAGSILNKIKQKIDIEELNYFINQKNTITMFDAVEKIGLGNIYRKKLYNIATKLMNKEKLKQPELFDSEMWAYCDYDNTFGCDAATNSFVTRVNDYNRKNFHMDVVDFQSSDEQKIIKCKELIDNQEEITEEKYISIIKEFFNMFVDKDRNINDGWSTLFQLSMGPGKTVAKHSLEEIISNSDDELLITRCSYLLREIEIYQYNEMLEENYYQNGEGME